MSFEHNKIINIEDLFEGIFVTMVCWLLRSNFYEECDSTFKTRSILRIHMSLNGDTHEQNNVQGFVRNVILHLNRRLNGNAHKVETWNFRNNWLC